MRSFAVIAGFAAAANAYAYGYPEAHNTTSSAAPYEATKPAEYPSYPVASSSKAEYPVYPASSSKAEYPVYPASSKTPEHPVYTTQIVTGVTTVCPEPTTVTYGTKTYVVSKSTTITDNEYSYTTSYLVHPTPAAHESYPAEKPSETHYAPPAYTSAPPAHVPYPSAGNGSVVYPTAGKPSASVTKPSTPEFTGAAAQAGVGLLAVVGAVAAFL